MIKTRKLRQGATSDIKKSIESFQCWTNSAYVPLFNKNDKLSLYWTSIAIKQFNEVKRFTNFAVE